MRNKKWNNKKKKISSHMELLGGLGSGCWIGKFCLSFYCAQATCAFHSFRSMNSAACDLSDSMPWSDCLTGLFTNGSNTCNATAMRADKMFGTDRDKELAGRTAAMSVG